MVLYKTPIANVLISLRRCAGWSVPVLFANPGRQVFLCRGPYCQCTQSVGSPFNLNIQMYITMTHEGKWKNANTMEVSLSVILNSMWALGW